MLQNNVKLIIWDLDETFWQGTLAEGAITPIEACKNCVITLAERGIISSICSKNDFEAAKTALIGIGVWDYFVFPRIEFGPKGQNIAAMIEEMNLRAENVLFIDDNVLNLEEAKHYAPGLMVADPVEILPVLLGLPQLAGKDDRELTRLRQYQRLEVKSSERAKSTASNEEFLRQCGIEVTIDHDLDKNFDRIVELANRTNQLNFTKKRLETPEDIAEFRRLCATHGVATGAISVVDKYGDYGMVGYYVVHRHYRGNELLHFAFSCRTMNMGIEQYIYEYLNEPDIEIVQPVSNPIKNFAAVNWIKEGTGAFAGFSQVAPNRRLVLIGGCELLQLATLCGNRRSEFANIMRDNIEVRFDDPGFILGDRAAMESDKALWKLGYWKRKDVAKFDRTLKVSQIVIVSLATFFWWDFFASRDGNLVRPTTATLKHILKTKGVWFVRNFHHRLLSYEDRVDLLMRSLERIVVASPPGCHRFVLGVNENALPEDRPGLREARRGYNELLRNFCASSRAFTFIDINSVVDDQDLMDLNHYSRRGHMALANEISRRIEEESAKRKAARLANGNRPPAARIPLAAKTPPAPTVQAASAPEIESQASSPRRVWRLPRATN
jgi:FkbH-like protein